MFDNLKKLLFSESVKFHECELKRLKTICSNIKKTVRTNQEIMKKYSSEIAVVKKCMTEIRIYNLCLRDLKYQIEKTQDKIEKYRLKLDQMSTLPPQIYTKKRNLFDADYYNRHYVFMEKELEFRKENGNLQYPNYLLCVPFTAKPVRQSSALLADVCQIMSP